MVGVFEAGFCATEVIKGVDESRGIVAMFCTVAVCCTVVDKSAVRNTATPLDCSVNAMAVGRSSVGIGVAISPLL